MWVQFSKLITNFRIIFVVGSNFRFWCHNRFVFCCWVQFQNRVIPLIPSGIGGKYIHLRWFHTSAGDSGSPVFSVVLNNCNHSPMTRWPTMSALVWLTIDSLCFFLSLLSFFLLLLLFSLSLSLPSLSNFKFPYHLSWFLWTTKH